MIVEYVVVDEQRVMIGLSAAETAEFEGLDGQIPSSAKPVWPDTMNSPIEQRWQALYTKHETARQAPERRFGGRATADVRDQKRWSKLYASPLRSRSEGMQSSQEA